MAADDLNVVHTPTPSPRPSIDLTTHSVTSRSSRAMKTQHLAIQFKHTGVDGAGKRRARIQKRNKRAQLRNGMNAKTRLTAKGETRHGQKKRYLTQASDIYPQYDHDIKSTTLWPAGLMVREFTAERRSDEGLLSSCSPGLLSWVVLWL